MVLDTSALRAVLLEEPDSAEFLARLSHPRPLLSAANWLELGIVIDARKGPQWLTDLDVFLESLEVTVVPVTAGQARIARDAYRRFGRGNHPAGLNLGDCFVYALAKERNLPLLFKGEGFARLTSARRSDGPVVAAFARHKNCELKARRSSAPRPWRPGE